MIGEDHGDMLRIGPQKQGLLLRLVGLADHPDMPVHRFKAVTYRAKSNRAACDGRIDPINSGAFVNEAGCKQYGAGHKLPSAPNSDKASLPAGLEHIETTSLDHRAVSVGLIAKALKQLRAGNAAEARIVMARRNEGCPTLAVIDQQRASAITREVDRGCKTRRASTDDKAVEHRASSFCSCQKLIAPAGLRSIAPWVPEIRRGCGNYEGSLALDSSRRIAGDAHGQSNTV